MNNINIHFMPHRPAQSSRNHPNHKFRTLYLHSSKSYYNMDNIYPEHNLQTLTQRRPSQISESNSYSKGKRLQMYQKQLQKNELQYRSIITSLQQQSPNNKSISKKQPQFSDKKERSLIIHSRNHPRCTFWKNKIYSNTQIQASEKQTKSSSARFRRSKNPQLTLQIPKAKRISLTPKNDRVVNKEQNKKQMNLLFKKSQVLPVRAKNEVSEYRPWSPHKRNVMDADQLGSIDKFIEINI